MMAMLKSIPRQRLILLSACLVGLIVLMGLIWRNASVEPVSRLPGGAFHLVDQTGKPVSENILKGKWSAVFFGFTYCPDVCPTTLQVLAQAQDQLGPRAKDFQVVFVSVDPGRDTPEQLANYLSNSAFPKATLGLTGTPAQIAQIARAYRVVYEKSGAGSDYVVNHSTATYLMNPKGRFDRVLPLGISPEEVTRQITAAMRGA